MLTNLHIRDFAIVERLELDFEPGMTTLTGETGAGKSILLDALGLALGDRAASDLVRHGADRAEVMLSFTVDDCPAAARWLADNDLEEDGECLIRRVVQENGRSKGYVNGRPTPLQMLRDLGEQLVDLHGQHEHQSLMKKDVQRTLLDEYAGNGELLARVADLYRRLREIEHERHELQGSEQDHQARQEILEYQLDELRALDLSAEAQGNLEAEQRRLAHAGELIETSQRLVQALYEDEQSAQSILGQSIRALEDLRDVDSGMAASYDMLASALVQIEEAADSLRKFVDDTDLDPTRLEWVDQQLQTLNDLARKHHARPEELPAVLQDLEGDLEKLQGSESRLAALAEERAAAEKVYSDLAGQLRARREKTAQELSSKTTDHLKHLGMGGAQFHIAVTPMESSAPTPHGLDIIEYQVRTNPGQPLGPLNRIASGGELSRISLAVQVVAARATHIPTLIFDEADSGIGGAIAEVVGRQLRQLAESHQVLCITHLPQVASQAHHHLRVEKASSGERTSTSVTPLSDDARIEEIARMLGGVEITAATLDHAREMVEKGQAAAP